MNSYRVCGLPPMVSEKKTLPACLDWPLQLQILQHIFWSGLTWKWQQQRSVTARTSFGWTFQCQVMYEDPVHKIPDFRDMWKTCISWMIKSLEGLDANEPRHWSSRREKHVCGWRDKLESILQGVQVVNLCWWFTLVNCVGVYVILVCVLSAFIWLALLVRSCKCSHTYLHTMILIFIVSQEGCSKRNVE